jgi:alginate O-acetyltransferase complex protein AlgJ
MMRQVPVQEILETQPEQRGIRVRRVWLVAAAMTMACASGPHFPWPQQPGAAAAPASRADVATVNGGYRRESSQVLIRKITRPSRAALDYAAYHANFMNADPPPEGAAAGGGTPDASHPFQGKLTASSLTGSIAATPLTADERAHALAMAPLVELMVSKHVAGADKLEDVVSAVRAEAWGLAGGPQIVRQTAALGYLHDAGAGHPVELWLQIEFAPWFHGFSGMPDDDGDGAANIYGRIDPAALGDTAAIATFIRTEYEGRVLTPTEVKGWAHQLASYWYPSYNTDLVPGLAVWPAPDTEAPVRKELGSLTLSSPTVVMRGKPQGQPVYNVFVVDGDGGAKEAAAPASAALKLAKSTPSPAPDAIARAIKAELAEHGGTWAAWKNEVAPLDAALKGRITSLPAGAKAFAGADDFLFFKQSVLYATGGDLGKQRRDRNPLPVIGAFRKLLAAHGVDLLFVPVPTKVEIYPDKAASSPTKDAGLQRFAGHVVNPFERKFLAELAAEGVESVDLMPAFLAARGEKAQAMPLYQAQDTHWTTRGLELAAKLVAERIRHYPWYKELATHKRTYRTKEVPFSRHGDLHSRLPEADKARYQPEALIGHQVLTASGEPYDDDPDSPVVLLGDSFTGVFQLMDCEHAGVSAHLARELGYPLDLVMSYGGGPNVRQKLLRRGEAALDTKKLVVWMMTARDLYDFAEGWQPLGTEK